MVATDEEEGASMIDCFIELISLVCCYCHCLYVCVCARVLVRMCIVFAKTVAATPAAGNDDAHIHGVAVGATV